jgi:hypothetical protein
MGRVCSTHGEKRNAYRTLVGKLEGKKPLKPRRRWVDNIKMDLREIGWDGMAQDKDRWRALVNTVMNLRVPQNARKFLRSLSRKAQLHE